MNNLPKFILRLVPCEVPKFSPIFISHWLSVVPEKKAGCGVENDTTKSYFYSSFHFHSLPSLFQSFFRRRSCIPARITEPWRARIVSNRERPDLTALPVNSYISEHCRKKNNQKFLFPAKSTWMPFGTRIFFMKFSWLIMTYYGLVDYKGVV